MSNRMKTVANFLKALDELEDKPEIYFFGVFPNDEPKDDYAKAMECIKYLAHYCEEMPRCSRCPIEKYCSSAMVNWRFGAEKETKNE